MLPPPTVSKQSGIKGQYYYARTTGGVDARFDERSISNFDTDRVSHDLRSRKMLSNDEVDK